MSEPLDLAAIDLGATSGRVVHGRVSRDRLDITDVARFPNGAREDASGALRWNVSGLFEAALGGLEETVRRAPRLAGIGVDSWAVDYGLLRAGELIEEPYSYRDARTARGVELVHAKRDHRALYRTNGLQFLPFNSLYQLAVDAERGILQRSDRALLVPDLLTFWLTGREVAEFTNASSTGLLDLRGETPIWDEALLADLGIDPTLLAPLVGPGETVGPVSDAIADRIGARPDVIAVGSHDTASAVVAVPARESRFAYISSGTWSLVGVETPAPVLTEESRLAGFTNEGGVDGRTRYLHNVMGLWLLSESLRTWSDRGRSHDLAALLDAAAAVAGPVGVFDADDASLLPPGDMPARIEALLLASDQPVPSTPAGLVRSILESLALAYARTLDTAARITGGRPEVVHIVGGGSQNELLCQLTADRTGLPVLAGPIEATAMGNLLVQARSFGAVGETLEELRDLVARTHPPKLYRPRG